ncbi:hypothetical protein MAM1_0395d10284 [Mucor ambiguus]|uniref:Arrestin C-terminal-like domain-containing protein n=1 Tax=Mucor ambiguus TaxID=91626 RepID=A0A0C9N3U5_9FUNG|nr:hypothetical protein MAM1_0395d10284 [Mucor ambiguus]
MFRKSVSIDLVEPIVCLRGEPKDKQTINILRGAVRLQLSHSILIHTITIQFVGVSKTLWPEGVCYYVYNYNKTHFSLSASQHWDKHILVDSTIPVCKNSVLLKKGTHSFPFEILLSNALSESIECGLGNVRYKLLCQVHVKPRFIFINKSILHTQRPVVLMRLPTLESQQQCITQTHVINDRGGQLTLVIEKSHLIPGSLIPISFYFSPSCQVLAVEQIDVKLIERQKYRAPSKQTNRILHHEIALSSPSSATSPHFLDNELRCVYAVPGKHTIQVRASTSHPNIRVRHWIQIYLRLELKDQSTKDLQMDAPISVLLSSLDDYLNLPVYTSKSNCSSNNALSTTSASSTTSFSSSVWLQKLYPIKQHNNDPLRVYNNQNHHLMKLITAPPPLYEEALA